jgi:hypothetical protein
LAFKIVHYNEVDDDDENDDTDIGEDIALITKQF